MTTTICGSMFTVRPSIPKLAGVYVVGGSNDGFNTWHILNVGESGDIEERIRYHDRRPCWLIQGYVQLQIFTHLEPNLHARRALEQLIRNQYVLPCGKV